MSRRQKEEEKEKEDGEGEGERVLIRQAQGSASGFPPRDRKEGLHNSFLESSGAKRGGMVTIFSTALDLAVGEFGKGGQA